MRRSVMAAAATAIFAATGCPSHHSSPKGIGGTCSSARECQAWLVCSLGLCATAYVPSLSCAAPLIVEGQNLGPVTDPFPSGCNTLVRAPVLPVQDLGQLKVGTSIPFDVPAGSTSFSVLSQEVGTTAVNAIVFQGQTIPNAVVPTNVLVPGGGLFFSDTDPIPRDAQGYPDATGALAYYAGFEPTMGSFTVPNTSAGLDLVRSAGELPQGTWTLTVNDWALECASMSGCTGGSTSGVYDVRVVTHTGGIRSPGTLDVEIYLATDPTSSPVKTSADAVANHQIGRMVEGLAAYYSQAGICIGTVTFHDLPDWAKTRFAPGGVVDITGNPPCDDLSQLFTLALAQNAAVHLFLADSLNAGTTTGTGGTVLGVDGAIPGPSGVPGTISSGAIVGLFDMLGHENTLGACSGARNLSGCGTDILAYVAAHEAGHWLGLYHPTEMTGDYFDPLTDTARCPCRSCAPLSTRSTCSSATNSQLMEPNFCNASVTCGGARNLMFWVVNPTYSAGELTSQQGEVMRLNPAVR